MLNRQLSCFFIITFAFLLYGCSAILGHRESLDDYEHQLIYDVCDYSQINEQIDNDPLLWALNGGALARQCKNYKLSNQYLDRAEDIFKQQELALFVKTSGEKINAVLVNNNVNDYQGENHEKIMTNVYKGLNFMSLGDFVNARVEFNRVLDRQRRAAEYFEKEIALAYDLFNQSQYMQYIDSPIRADDEINDYIGDTTIETIYPNFVNPFATYLSALFFYIDQDYAKANDLFKQTSRMLPTQRQVKLDVSLSENLSLQQKKYIWLIYENGQGMLKGSVQYRFPTFLFSRDIITSDVSLPVLHKRQASYSFLQLNQQQTTVIVDMDSIIQLEFKKKLPAVITEAMLNMIAKSAIQYSLEQNFEAFGGKWLGFLYQRLTDTADIRQWRAMPKNFQIARIEMTKEPIIISSSTGKSVAMIDNLKTDRDAIIYIKSDIVDHNHVHVIQK